MAHHKNYQSGWGYILDDPNSLTPKQCVHYSFQSGVACVLSTYHILNVLVDYVNDFIEDREESRYSSKDIDLFYRLAEKLLTTYRDIPSTYKGMVSRSSSILALTLDGLGIVVPPETFIALNAPQGSLFFMDFKQRILESLTQQKPGLGLLLARDLWFNSSQESLLESGTLLGQVYQALKRDPLEKRIRQIQKHLQRS